MNDGAWLRIGNAGVILNLYVQPGAKRSEIAGLHGNALKIRLAAPPIEGRANACLIDFLADILQLPRAQITLLSGQASRAKRVAIAALAAEVIRDRLLFP
jgi:uncharacterized protein (TIGR00251 family)